uniref:Tetraspanin n=1 Tax=Anopheles culicifacies TaxID=139723 RepID=A0A182MAK1_9DIPT
MTELWDRLQNEGRCCGVTGPQDFALNANRTYPTSCCTSDITEQISIGRRPLASAIVFRGGEDPTAAVAAATELAASTLKDTLLMSRNFTELSDSWSLITAPSSGSSSTSGTSAGCADRIVSWLRHTADILFVLGYCVIAFLKLCFLGILRYEIKEMIQKIKLLQTEMSGAILNGVDCDQQQIQQVGNAIRVKSTDYF